MSTHNPGHSQAPLRFAFIGTGSIARKHLAALQRIPRARLVAVCDTSEQSVMEFANAAGVTPYRDYREMLANEEIDIASVLVPSGLHAGISIDVARSGHHVIVEKPMALTVEDADAQIEACAESGARMFVVLQNRFSVPVQLTRRALEEGRFGKLVSGSVRVRWCRDQAYYDAARWRGTWGGDGGVFCNQACHHLDLLLWMLGDVAGVSAIKATRLADIEAEDTGAAILRFANGAIGVVEATTAWRPTDMEGSFSICGENGSVEIGGFVVDQLRHWRFVDEDTKELAALAPTASNPQVHGWTHEQFLRDVVDAVLDDHPALCDAAQGRRTVELINAIYESSETGREVTPAALAGHSPLGRVEHAR